MQKILIVHNHYRIPGGEDSVAANEAELLRAHGHEVITYERSNADPCGKLRMALAAFFDPFVYHELRALIRREHIDIVHVHNTIHRIGPAVFYAAAAEGVPVVQTVHNFRLLCPAGTFFRKDRVCEDCVRYGRLCALKHRCYRGSLLQTAVMCASSALHRLTGIRRRVALIFLTEFNRKKLCLAPNAQSFIKPNFTQPGERAACDGHYLVLGRIERLKGSALIAKAFAGTERKLIFAGDGEQLDALRAYIARNDLRNIECPGRLEHEEAMKLLASARALIMAPQWYEGMSMNILEAFARGIPVLAADIGNAGAMVRDGYDGMVFKNNVRDLRKAVERFEAADREELSANARREYEEKYSPEVNYRMLKEIYDRLEGRKKP